MPDVFISYARSSERQARAAADALRDDGYSVWIDDELPSHRAYSEVIEEKLAAARAVLVLWSDEAVRSQWVRSEANRARGQAKLVQLRLDQAHLPMPFDQIQCADLTGWTGAGEHPGWPKVVSSVAQLVGATAPVKRAQPRAASLLAVLPFDAGDPDTAPIAEAVSEEALHALSGRAKVVGRTQSFRFRGKRKAEAAAALGASHVLDGAVRRHGERYRISAQLVQTAGGAVLWSERFDLEAGEPLVLAEAAAARLADAVAERLGAAAPPAPTTVAPTAAPGERRHVTLLSGRLEWGAGLDPEVRGEREAAVRRLAAGVVEGLGGRMAGAEAGALTAVFGFPAAQEDAAERAVRAGLALVSAAGEPFAGVLALAVHAGMVVAREGAEGRVEVIGDAPAAARAAASLTPAGAVALTAAAGELVAGLFVLEDLGEAEVPGLQGRLHRAVRPGLAGRRGRGFARGAFTPFVGREEELGLLLGRWERVREGEGQAVLVSGEAGIGKSRLVEAFRDAVRAQPHLWMDGGGAPLNANTPFFAVARMLRQGLGADDGEEGGPEAILPRLEAALAASAIRLDEAVPLIAEMLELPVPDRYPPLDISPDQRRGRLLAALVAWVFSASRDQPLIVVIEDLHWVDPSTLELVQTLAEQGATAPLLLIATSRSEFRPPWPQRGHHAQITLGRLSNRQTRDLVAAVAAGLPDEVVERVIERTDGVPLFAEELTRLMQEGAGVARSVPATLQDSLTARLDRLGPARETAQLAAVLGREFSFALIAAVSSGDDEALASDLARLADAEVVYARGAPPHASYRFKHALVQDAAYETLLRSRRRELHARAAGVIAGHFADLGEAQPELLARHWTEAGEAAKAIAAWRRAGESAYRRRAFKEAEAACRQALAIVGGEAASPERDRTELEFASRLTRLLALTRGYAAPETLAAAARAKALAETAGTLSQLIREEGAIWQAMVTAGDYAGSAALADHILELVRTDVGNPARLVFAHNAQIQTRFYTGDLAGVEEHYAFISPLIERPDIRQAPGNNAISLGVASLAAWTEGRDRSAQERHDRAAALAERTGDPYDLAMCLHFRGLLGACRRDPAFSGEAAQQLLDLATRNGLAYVGELASGVLGWAKAMLGEAAEGASLIDKARAGLSGGQVGRTFGLALAAEIHGIAGDLAAARQLAELALTVNPQERVFRPLGLIVRAGLAKPTGGEAAAEHDLVEAMTEARASGAKGWELRAALALADLMARRGETAKGRWLVAPIAEAMPEPPCAADRARIAALGC